MLTQNRAIALVLSAFLALSAPVAAYASGGGEGEEGAAKPVGPMYVDFKNIVVPVIKKNGRTGVIAISMMAEVKDDAAQKSVTNHMPKLRDAFIRTLYGNMDSKRFTKADGALDIENIKSSLMKSARFVMKTEDPQIQDILFQNISQQTY